MTVYLDTSLIISSLVNEPRSAVARAAMSRSTDENPLISFWVITEFSAALSVKVRTGVIDAVARSRLLGKFATYRSEVWTTVAVSGHHFFDAAALADRPGIALRASDALHLAIAADSQADLWTLDSRFSEAAKALGYRAVLF